LFIHLFNRIKLRNSTPGFLNTSTAKFTVFLNNFFSSCHCGKQGYFASCISRRQKACLAVTFAYLNYPTQPKGSQGFKITINDSLCCKNFRHLLLYKGLNVGASWGEVLYSGERSLTRLIISIQFSQKQKESDQNRS